MCLKTAFVDLLDLSFICMRLCGVQRFWLIQARNALAQPKANQQAGLMCLRSIVLSFVVYVLVTVCSDRAFVSLTLVRWKYDIAQVFP